MPSLLFADYLGGSGLPLQVVVSSNSAVSISTVTFNGVAQPVSIASMPSTPVTGTFWQVTQPVNGTVTANLGTLPALTKGTQGATGFSIQELKDAGRTNVVYYVRASTVGATTVESALTFTKSIGTAATSSGYTVAITNGKTLRITHIGIATQGNAVATAQSTIFNLRVNTAGACTAASTPIVFSQRCATTAVAGAWDRLPVPIGDGYEITGTATLQFCASVNSTYTANAPTADMVIMGYEY